MKWIRAFTTALLTLALVLTGSACARSPDAERVVRTATPDRYLVCARPNGYVAPPPVDTVIGVRGGTLKVGGHELQIKERALTDTVRIRLEEMGSDTLGVRIESQGGPVKFLRPAKVLVSTDRCTDVDTKAWKVWRFAAWPPVAGDEMATGYPWFSNRLRTFIDHNSWVIIAD